MTIVELLKHTKTHLTIAHVWLRWDECARMWMVCRKARTSKRIVTLAQTLDESEAVAVFMEAARLED